MTARRFSDDRAKSRITEAVAAAEKLTSAEVVVAIRRHASSYVRTSLVAGGIAAGLALVYLWFSPTIYDVRFMPLEAVLVFAVVAFLSQSIDVLRYRLTPGHRMASALDGASREAFTTIGVERTKRRNGVLIYAGLFERRVRVVPDIGVDWAALGNAGREVEERLNQAVLRRDLQSFTSSLVDLGGLLAEHHPVNEDDENELCDGPH